jgi:hypothetical protein
MIVIVRGKSTKTEDFLREVFREEIDAGEIDFISQENAWCDQRVTQWWIEQFPHFPQVPQGDRLDLIWDCFASQRSEETWQHMTEVGESLGIRFERHMIPAGMTGELQPCDVRLNGELNARVNGAADRLHGEGGEFDRDVVNAVLFELEAWRMVTRRNIIKGWKPLLGEARINTICANLEQGGVELDVPFKAQMG